MKPGQRKNQKLKFMFEWLEGVLKTQNYELVDLEIIPGREAVVRVFIDRTDGQQVDVEDCVRVTEFLDQPLDQHEEIIRTFPSGYELEVSSPGIDRPLRKITDYQKFEGERVHIYTHRALTPDEGENAEYIQKNPKQKHFYGILRGAILGSGSSTPVGAIREAKIILGAIADDGSAHVKTKPGKAKKAAAPKENRILIPHSLVLKANLEREVITD